MLPDSSSTTKRIQRPVRSRAASARWGARPRRAAQATRPTPATARRPESIRPAWLRRASSSLARAYSSAFGAAMRRARRVPESSAVVPGEPSRIDRTPATLRVRLFRLSRRLSAPGLRRDRPRRLMRNSSGRTSRNRMRAGEDVGERQTAACRRTRPLRMTSACWPAVTTSEPRASRPARICSRRRAPADCRHPRVRRACSCAAAGDAPGASSPRRCQAASDVRIG